LFDGITWPETILGELVVNVDFTEGSPVIPSIIALSLLQFMVFMISE